MTIIHVYNDIMCMVRTHCYNKIIRYDRELLREPDEARARKCSHRRRPRFYESDVVILLLRFDIIITTYDIIIAAV